MSDAAKSLSSNEIRNDVIIVKTQGENPQTSEFLKNTTPKHVFPTGAFFTKLSTRFDDRTYYGG